ncbi:MAG: hypothetical protein HY719_07930 [Planctomycetes bacterium]|nr:hypothetical protein [Planctomycetota bacterium]
MKVLFVGEGPHDIGRAPPHGGKRERPAGGVVFNLARRAVPSIGEDSISLTWLSVADLAPKSRKPGKGVPRGWRKKVGAAVLLSTTRYGCAGTVMVVDEGDHQTKSRRSLAGVELAEGAIQAGRNNRDHAIATGVVVQSIEAWTIGAVDALAREVGVSVKTLTTKYPEVAQPESLHQEKETGDMRASKPLLQEIARSCGQDADTAFRERVARTTNVDKLAKTCPLGFRPFLEQLREHFNAEP